VTPEEERNFAVSEKWERLYHEDVGRMCDECYAPECEVVIIATGESVRGRDKLKAGELGLLKAAPDRTLRSFNRIARGNQVVVELVWEGTHTGSGMGVPPTGKSWKVGACAIQTFEDGLVVREHTYGEIMMQFQLGIAPTFNVE
jgi:predicted ester cyclase